VLANWNEWAEILFYFNGIFVNWQSRW